MPLMMRKPARSILAEERWILSLRLMASLQTDRVKWIISGTYEASALFFYVLISGAYTLFFYLHCCPSIFMEFKEKRKQMPEFILFTVNSLERISIVLFSSRQTARQKRSLFFLDLFSNFSSCFFSPWKNFFCNLLSPAF